MAEMRHFPESNCTLLAPECREDVADLPVFRHNGGVISCWQLTEEEVSEVMRTGLIWLHVNGPTHPPVYVNGKRPFPPRPR